jgi:hypothetical protein
MGQEPIHMGTGTPILVEALTDLPPGYTACERLRRHNNRAEETTGSIGRAKFPSPDGSMLALQFWRVKTIFKNLLCSILRLCKRYTFSHLTRYTPDPMRDAQAVFNEQFLEMRWRALSLAADLDRIQRAAGGEALLKEDARMVQLRRIFALLQGDQPSRAEQAQMLLSDLSAPPR